MVKFPECRQPTTTVLLERVGEPVRLQPALLPVDQRRPS
jgi:hypothetical protein